MAQVVSKLGIHRNGPRAPGYGEFLSVVANANRQLAVIKCRDDFGGMDEPLKYWPDVLTIGTRTDWDDADLTNVALAQARLSAAIVINPKVKYWEYTNERAEWARQADLYIALMPFFTTHARGLCAFNCASGTPPYYSEDGGEAYRAILRVAQAARAGGHAVLIGVHGYGYDAANCLLRYRDLAAYLRSHEALIPFVLTEFGDEEAGFRGVDRFMEWCRVIDSELMRDDYLWGAALFTLGGGWNDYSPALWNAKYETSALGDYIATVEAPEPPPPPIERILDVRPRNVSLQVVEDTTLPRGQAEIRHAADVTVRIIALGSSS